VVTAKKKPIKAKGIANMVCEKVTNDKYFFILFLIPLLRGVRGVFRRYAI
jgi:hypothetical protein